MTMKQSKAHLAEVEGRHYRGPDVHGDIPVFDKPNSRPTAVQRTGLAGTNGSDRGFLFRRDERDARPGTPIPWGEPHPDRLALAEERRRILQAQDEKYMLPQNHKLRGPRTTPMSSVNGAPRNMSKTKDIPEPVNPYTPCPEADILVSCTRGGRTLQFSSVNRAALCLVGDNKYSTTKAIQNAATGVVRSAFGWEWTRHRSGRGKR